MSKLPKYFLMNTWKKVEEELDFPDILDYFEDENGHELIQRLYNENYENTIHADKLTEVRRKRNQTKKRWVKNIIKEYEKPGSTTMKELRLDYEQLLNYEKTFGKEQFFHTFNKKGNNKENISINSFNPKAIIEEKIQALHSWSQDIDSYLTHYPYIKNRTKLQIKKAIISDILDIIGNIIIKEYDGKIMDMIVEKPYSYIDNPIFANEKGKMPVSSKIIQTKNTSYVYNDYQPEPASNYKLRTLIPIDEKPRFLDERDQEIFYEIMKQRTISFAKQRKIFVDIGQIVKNVFKSTSINNYKKVEERIYKMFNTRFQVYYKDGSEGFGIFDYVNIHYKKKTSWTAEITVNEYIHQEYIKKQTIRMYKDILNNFESALTKNLVFVLQKERFSRHLGIDSYKQEYDYSFFIHKLRFKARNKKNNLLNLETAFAEMIEHNVILKNFTRSGEVFKLEFLPITEYELEDLVHHNYIEDDNIIGFSNKETELMEVLD